MTAPTSNHNYDHQMTRRSILMGAASLCICPPAIAQVTSPVQVQGLVKSIERPLARELPYMGFCQRVMYESLEGNLKTGRMTTKLNGEIVTEAEARRMVAGYREFLTTERLAKEGANHHGAAVRE